MHLTSPSLLKKEKLLFSDIVCPEAVSCGFVGEVCPPPENSVHLSVYSSFKECQMAALSQKKDKDRMAS